MLPLRGIAHYHLNVRIMSDYYVSWKAPQLKKTDADFKKALSLTRCCEHAQNSLSGCGSTEQMPHENLYFLCLHIMLSHVRHQPVANI